MLFGALAGLVGAGFFVFPVKVDPLESLSLWTAMAAFGVILALRAYGSADARYLARAGGAASLAVFALAAWAMVRWRFAFFPAGLKPETLVPIRSAGRDGVLAFQFLAFGFAMGLGLGGLESARAAAAWRVFRKMLVAAALGFAALGLYQFFFGYEATLERLRASPSTQAEMDPLLLQSLEHALGERRVGGTLGNGNVFAAWLCVLVIASISMMPAMNPRPVRIAGMAGAALAGVTLLLTGSRGGLLTLAIAVTAALAVLRKVSPAGGKKPVALGAASGLLAAAFVLMSRPGWAIDIGYRLTRITTIRERLNYWSIAAKVWLADPVFGGGPGAFELLYPQLKAATARESRYAHSWMFQALAELGLIGLMLWVMFGLALAFAARRAWRSLPAAVAGPLGDVEASRSAEALWLAAMTATLAFNGLFEYSLHTPEFLALFGIASGGLIGLAPASPFETSARGIATLRGRAAATGLLAIGCLAASGWLIPRAQFAAEWEWRAKGAALAGDPFLASGYYARASRLLPEDEGILVRWSGELAQLAGRQDEAGALLERAEAMNPLSASIRASRARHFQRTGEPDRALEKLDEAVELYPTDARYRIERARFLLGAGLKEGALRDVREIEEQGLPVWAYLRPQLDGLREELGLPATAETLREREREARRVRRQEDKPGPGAS